MGFEAVLLSASGPRSDTGLTWPPSLTVDWLVFGPLIVATALVVVRAVVLDRRVSFSLWNRIGPANWDLSKSWASNVTVLGATLGTIIAAKGVVPDTTSHLSNASFAGLDVFFGVLVAIAPLFFNAFRTVKQRHNRHGDKEAQFVGFVGTFFIAAIITLWGCIGQLATLLALVQEIQAAGSLSPEIVDVLGAVFASTIILAVIYAWISIGAIAIAQTDLKKQEKELIV